MKWKKRGKIFDPTTDKVFNEFHEFAQSPQALVFDDFVRIYFSVRTKDSLGKYLSHIAFVDMDKSFSKIINRSAYPVIELGSRGCFDEHGIFPMNVVRDKNKIIGYTCGWSRRISVPVETSIGMATSNDNGQTFTKAGDGPVLTSSLNEPFLVGDPFVTIFNGTYFMWYIYGTRWIQPAESEFPERVYKIGYATSTDGITWQKKNKQIITDKLNADECQALPSVIKFGNRYLMVFCYRQATDFRKNKMNAYRLGLASSENLNHWVRDDESLGIDISENGWDSDMMCYPNIFECDGKVYLLYNGNEFGRYGFGLAVLEN